MLSAPGGGGPPSWPKAAPDSRAIPSNPVRLIILNKPFAPWSRSISARCAAGGNQMCQRLHRGWDRHRDLFIHLVQERIIAHMRNRARWGRTMKRQQHQDQEQ